MQVSAIHSNHQVSYTGKGPKIPNAIKQDLKDTFNNASEHVKNSGFFTKAKDFMIQVGTTVKNVAVRIWQAIKEFFSLSEPYSEKIKEKMEKLKDLMSNKTK